MSTSEDVLLSLGGAKKMKKKKKKKKKEQVSEYERGRVLVALVGGAKNAPEAETVHVPTKSSAACP